MNKKLLSIALLSTVILSGCGAKKDTTGLVAPSDIIQEESDIKEVEEVEEKEVVVEQKDETSIGNKENTAEKDITNVETKTEVQEYDRLLEIMERGEAEEVLKNEKLGDITLNTTYDELLQKFKGKILKDDKYKNGTHLMFIGKDYVEYGIIVHNNKVASINVRASQQHLQTKQFIRIKSEKAHIESIYEDIIDIRKLDKQRGSNIAEILNVKDGCLSLESENYNLLFYLDKDDRVSQLTLANAKEWKKASTIITKDSKRLLNLEF